MKRNKEAQEERPGDVIMNEEEKLKEENEVKEEEERRRSEVGE